MRVRCTALCLWLVALGASITSLVFSEIDSDFYSVSEVCVGLLISRRSIFVKTNEIISIQAEWHPYFGKRTIAEYILKQIVINVSLSSIVYALIVLKGAQYYRPDRVVFTSEDYSLVVIFKRVFNRKVKTPCSVCHIDSTLSIVRDA